MSEFNLVGPSYVTTSRNSDCQRTVNFYPEVVESGMGKGKVSLESAPGLEVANYFEGRMGTGGIYTRINALFVDQERMWVVACGGLYEFSDSGATFKVELSNGTNCPNNSAISIASNGVQLLICASDFGTMSHGVWVYDIKNNTVTLLDETAHSDVYKSTQCAFLGGYFILFQPVETETSQWSQKFYISGLYDGLSWDALDFASAEGNPDRIMAICVDHNELWLFGRQTAEVFVLTGASPFPFERASTAVLDFGIISFRTLAKLDNSLFFLAGDQRGTGMLYRTRGYQVERVSNHAVEASLATGDFDMETCYAYSYSEAGHSFYCLTHTAGKANWVYDSVSGMWHERGNWNETGQDFIAYPFVSHCHFKNKHYVCGPEAESIAPAAATNKLGILYRQSVNYPTRAGDPIRRLRVTPHLSGELAYQFYHQIWLDVSVKAAGAVTPVVTMDWSNDGGRTWSNPHPVTMPVTNTAGESKFRTIWRRLGHGRDRVFRFYVEAACRWSVTNGYMHHTPGTGI